MLSAERGLNVQPQENRTVREKNSKSRSAVSMYGSNENRWCDGSLNC